MLRGGDGGGSGCGGSSRLGLLDLPGIQTLTFVEIYFSATEFKSWMPNLFQVIKSNKEPQLFGSASCNSLNSLGNGGIQF